MWLLLYFETGPSLYHMEVSVRCTGVVWISPVFHVRTVRRSSVSRSLWTSYRGYWRGLTNQWFKVLLTRCRQNRWWLRDYRLCHVLSMSHLCIRLSVEKDWEIEVRLASSTRKNRKLDGRHGDTGSREPSFVVRKWRNVRNVCSQSQRIHITEDVVSSPFFPPLVNRQLRLETINHSSVKNFSYTYFSNTHTHTYMFTHTTHHYNPSILFLVFWLTYWFSSLNVQKESEAVCK